MDRGALSYNIRSLTVVGGISNYRTEHRWRVFCWGGYPPHKTQYIVSGFTEGFRLRLDTHIPAIACETSSHTSHSKSNHKLARVNPKAIKDKLSKEHVARRMIGTFSNLVFPHFIVSPLSLREKKTPGQFWVIHDLSAPFGGLSVNSHIPKEAGTVSYDTVDKSISLIQYIGPGYCVSKNWHQACLQAYPNTSQLCVSSGMMTCYGTARYLWALGLAV